MPNNRQAVFSRSKSTLERLSKDTQKVEDCTSVMQKYIDLKHVEAVPIDEQDPKHPGKCWWVPVFPVTHPKKKKSRIVFDSSARYSGVSLNDCLIPGPDVITRLKLVLIGFRNGSIGFSADIECMFHNFLLNEADRDYIRFFWYKDNDPSNDIVQYRANVHIFGNCSSPSIAAMGLRYAASQSPTSPQIIKFVEEQFYVDDALGSTDSVDEAVSLLNSTIDTLKIFKIRLHKICSSSPGVLKSFPASELTPHKLIDFEGENAPQSVLGLRWDTDADRLVVSCEIPDRPFTRRGILATVNSVFDPLGICAPILLEGKHLQRQIISNDSRSETYWDEDLPAEHLNSWLSWKESLQRLSGLSIPRGFRSSEFGSNYVMELHGFSDASQYGTGYVIYARSVNHKHETSVSFILGNSKIIPKSSPTIPRLELCAAVDLAIQMTEVADKLNVTSDRIFLYSDSQIVLGYLLNTAKRFQKYVARRVEMILKLYDSSRWRYVRSEDNPADIASRKQTIESLTSSCWLSGPGFLHEETDHTIPHLGVELPDKLPETSALVTSRNDPSIISAIVSKFSSLRKAQAVLKYVLNFARKLFNRVILSKGLPLPLRKMADDHEALDLFVRQSQKESFSDVLFDPSSYKGKLSPLSPFIDGDGILRVGGRLRHSDLDYENKYPTILPKEHPLTDLMISHFHSKVRHQGRCITLSALRRSGYFIHNGSGVIRRFIRSCITCKKLRHPLDCQRMSDLPRDRLQCVPPFERTGLDVLGPFEITDGKLTRRNTSTKKMWAVIFTCLHSRAVHLEPLFNLDISSMRNAMRRFFSIRGPCRRLRSDQGTNFVGVHNQDLVSATQTECDLRGCTWEFNPPKASHQGGVWERPIQTVKKIMSNCVHSVGSRLLSRDEFMTFLQECACILNNSPLWEFSADPNDPAPLSPAMLLNLRGNEISDHACSPSDIFAYGSKRWRRRCISQRPVLVSVENRLPSVSSKEKQMASPNPFPTSWRCCLVERQPGKEAPVAHCQSSIS